MSFLITAYSRNCCQWITRAKNSSQNDLFVTWYIWRKAKLTITFLSFLGRNGTRRFAARCIASRIAMARFIEAITVLGSRKVKLRIAYRGMKVFNEILKGSATSFKKVSNDKGHFTVHSLPLRSVTSLFGVRSFVLFFGRELLSL